MTTAQGKPHIVKRGRLWECSGPYASPLSYLRWSVVFPVGRHGVSAKHAYDCWLSATRGEG